jgi:hypothetical protein
MQWESTLIPNRGKALERTNSIWEKSQTLPFSVSRHRYLTVILFAAAIHQLFFCSNNKLNHSFFNHFRSILYQIGNVDIFRSSLGATIFRSRASI